MHVGVFKALYQDQISKRKTRVIFIINNLLLLTFFGVHMTNSCIIKTYTYPNFRLQPIYI